MGRGNRVSEPSTAGDADVGGSGTESEVRELRETIVVLRAELETAQDDHDAALQAANARAADAAAQTTIAMQALREELERLEARRVQELEEAEQRAHDEQRQLGDTIRALRAELEARDDH